MSKPFAHTPNIFWHDTARPCEPSPRLRDKIEQDVVIIGAGFTGLRAAVKLAEAGSNVTVLDAGDVGWGASGRTGGQVNPMLPFNGPDQLRKILTPKYFDRLTEASLNSADELFTLIQKYQIECEARQHGWLRVDHSTGAQVRSWQAAERWNDFGAHMTQVDGDELIRLTGTRAYKTGVLAPGGGAVQPLSLARGWARVARAAGVSIFGQSDVVDLKRTNGKWTVGTANGHVRADWVIVATNGYTGDLLPKLPKTIMPLVPIQIATSPLTEDQIGTILPQGHTISDTRRIIMYARREPGNQMVFGGLGRMTLGGEIKGHDWLIKDAERIFPQLKGVDWAFRWGGQIAITEDRLPHLHEPQKGLLVGLGYNGRGVAMSHVMGRVMAERVLGADPGSLSFPVTAVTPMRWRGTQMIGKGAAVWMMRLLDGLEFRPN